MVTDGTMSAIGDRFSKCDVTIMAVGGCKSNPVARKWYGGPQADSCWAYLKPL